MFRDVFQLIFLYFSSNIYARAMWFFLEGTLCGLKQVQYIYIHQYTDLLFC